jgi:tRNA pseudouridine55 synthase
VHGLLIVDKPAGPTSHDVVARVRAALGGVRTGHTGTLDPLATGVLVLAIGNATRLCRYLESTKEYLATVLLGVETDTLDVTGTVVRRSDACSTLEGEVEQTPPMFSAVRSNGTRLYHLARKGVSVARRRRTVSISAVEVLDYDPPRVRIRVACSAGTYVRVIASTLGEKLGCGACLEALTRTRAGPFTLEKAASLDDVLAEAASGKLAERLVAATAALAHLPALVLSRDQAVAVSHGQAIGEDHAFLVRMCGPDGDLIAIGEAARARPVTVLKPSLTNSE